MTNIYSGTLNGADSAYSAVNGVDFQPTVFTVGGWVKRTAIGVNHAIMCSYSTDKGFIFVVTSTDRLRLYISDSIQSPDAYSAESVAGSIQLGTWTWCVGNYNGTNAIVYINGTAMGTSAITMTPSYNATNYVRVGCRNNTGTNIHWFNGKLDEVFLIKGTALTAAQISGFYNQYITGATTYYKFENNTNDSSGTNTLTAIGTPAYSTDVPFNIIDRIAGFKNLLGVGL